MIVERALDTEYIFNKFGEELTHNNDIFDSVGWFKFDGKHIRFNKPYQDHELKTLTIVISNWERFAYMPYLMHQVLNQDYDYSKVEIIVIDQNSVNKEEIYNFCEKTAKANPSVSLKLIQHFEDPVQSPRLRRNTGMKFASKEYCVVIETDTLILCDNAFKAISWAFHNHPKALLIASAFGISNIGNILKGWSGDKYTHIDQPLSTWLPFILSDPKFQWSMVKRYSHDFVNAFSTEIAKTVEGCDENYVGWGGFENNFYCKIHRMGVEPLNYFKLLSVHLPNFPNKLPDNCKIAPTGFGVDKTTREWGTTSNMKVYDFR